MGRIEDRRTRDEAEDAGWASINETRDRVAGLEDKFSRLDDKVDIIDKGLVEVKGEVHSIGRAVNQLASSVHKNGEEVSSVISRLAERVQDGKLPNWQAYSVIFSVVAGLGIGIWTFNNATIDHNAHIANIKNQHIKEVMDLKNAHLKELIEANGQHQTEITDLKIENASLKAKP